MKIFNKAVLVIIFILLMLPLYFMLIGSFQDIYGVMAMPPNLLPRNIVLDNYMYLLKDKAITWLMNTVAVVMSSVILSILLSSMSGYVFAIYDFKFKNTLWSILLVQMMIPRIALLIPLFVIMKDMHLSGTLTATVLPIVMSPSGMYLARNYFESIPKSIIESARIDGASEWQILGKIVLPVSKPIISALGLFSGIFALQDYLWQMLVLIDENKQTLLVGLMKLSMKRGGESSFGVNPIGRGFATGILLLLPLVILFVIGNKYFVEGLQGAIKE